MKYELYFKSFLTQIEETLEKILPNKRQHPAVIHDAMRYSVLSGGKRFRPILTLSACEAVKGKPENALIPAIALELIHAYSLVHDDLPALDNDEMRRGKPTCHKKFGESMAILAGDGLLTLAFQILTQIKPAEKAVKILEEISTAAGTYGMIGGQVSDLVTAQANLNLPMLDYISSHKTGKLIKAGAICGALAGNAPEDALVHLQRYGEAIGLAFQFVDDSLDGDGYARLIKTDEICEKVRDLIALAKREVKSFGKRADKLVMLADFLVKRLPQKTHVAVDR